MLRQDNRLTCLDGPVAVRCDINKIFGVFTLRKEIDFLQRQKVYAKSISPRCYLCARYREAYECKQAYT